MRLQVAPAAFALLAWAGPSLRPAQHSGVNNLIPTKKEKLMTVEKNFSFWASWHTKTFRPIWHPMRGKQNGVFFANRSLLPVAAGRNMDNRGLGKNSKAGFLIAKFLDVE